MVFQGVVMDTDIAGGGHVVETAVHLVFPGEGHLIVAILHDFLYRLASVVRDGFQGGAGRGEEGEI